MDKINPKDFPSLEGVTMVPTKLWEKLDIDFLSRSEKNYNDYLNGKTKGYTEDEFFSILEKEGL